MRQQKFLDHHSTVHWHWVK